MTTPERDPAASSPGDRAPHTKPSVRGCYEVGRILTEIEDKARDINAQVKQARKDFWRACRTRKAILKKFPDDDFKRDVANILVLLPQKTRLTQLLASRKSKINTLMLNAIDKFTTEADDQVEAIADGIETLQSAIDVFATLNGIPDPPRVTLNPNPTITGAMASDPASAGSQHEEEP